MGKGLGDDEYSQRFLILDHLARAAFRPAIES